MFGERIKYTTYLAGAIENVKKKEEAVAWRVKVTEELTHPNLLIYDPIAQEASKVGKPSVEQCNYIAGLKRAGHWDKFYDEMRKIWLGQISQNTDLMQLFINLRMRKHIDGNRREEISAWGDFEAVVRSDFIVVYLPMKTKTVGTIYEVMTAFLFRLPIYLIVPDGTKTDTNSSLLYGVLMSGGKIFNNVSTCIKIIKEDYNLITKD